MARHLAQWTSFDTTQPDVLVVVFDLCFVVFFTGTVTGTALGTTTGAAVTTGTMATGTTAAGTVATVGATGGSVAVAVVVGAVGATTSTAGGTVGGSFGTEASDAPALVCQPMAATIVNSAVAEAPAVMIFEIFAGLARLRFCFWGTFGAARRAGGDRSGSIIAATAVVAATLTPAVSALMIVESAVATD